MTSNSDTKMDFLSELQNRNCDHILANILECVGIVALVPASRVSKTWREICHQHVTGNLSEMSRSCFHRFSSLFCSGSGDPASIMESREDEVKELCGRAAFEGHLDVLRWVQPLFPKPYPDRLWKNTMLQVAARNGHWDVFDYCRTAFNIELPSPVMFQVMQWAVKDGQGTFLESLTEDQGSETLATAMSKHHGSGTCQELLRSAIRSGKKAGQIGKAIEWLIKTCPKCTPADWNRILTKLVVYIAPLKGGLKILKYLHESHPEVLKNTDNLVQILAKSGDIPTLQWVMATYPNRVDLSRTRFGQNAFHIACEKSLEVLEFLYNTGRNKQAFFASDDQGKDLLHYACRSGKTEIVTWLLENFSDHPWSFKRKDETGSDAIDEMILARQLDTFAHLLEHQYQGNHGLSEANPDQLSGMMLFAVEHDHLPTIKWILQRFPEHKEHCLAKIDIQGRTLVQIAELNKSLEALELLSGSMSS